MSKILCYYYCILPPGCSGWIIGVGELRNSSTAAKRQSFGLGRRELFFFHARFTGDPSHTHSSLLAFFVLFDISCSHMRVFVIVNLVNAQVHLVNAQVNLVFAQVNLVNAQVHLVNAQVHLVFAQVHLFD